MNLLNGTQLSSGYNGGLGASNVSSDSYGTATFDPRQMVLGAIIRF